MEHWDLGEGVVAYGLDGYPADCVLFGVQGLSTLARVEEAGTDAAAHAEVEGRMGEIPAWHPTDG